MPPPSTVAVPSGMSRLSSANHKSRALHGCRAVLHPGRGNFHQGSIITSENPSLKEKFEAGRKDIEARLWAMTPTTSLASSAREPPGSNSVMVTFGECISTSRSQRFDSGPAHDHSPFDVLTDDQSAMILRTDKYGRSVCTWFIGLFEIDQGAEEAEVYGVLRSKDDDSQQLAPTSERQSSALAQTTTSGIEDEQDIDDPLGVIRALSFPRLEEEDEQRIKSRAQSRGQ